MADGARYKEVLDSFVAQSRAVGERMVSLARVIIFALLVARDFVTSDLTGTPRQISHLVMLALTLAISFAIHRVVQPSRPGRHTVLVGVSVVLDAVICAASLAILTIWPPEGYVSLTQSSTSGYVFLVIMFSALRFSAPLVVTSLLANGGLLVALLLIDAKLMHRPVANESLITMATLYVATGVFGLVAVHRARTLIIDGARSVLDAQRATHHLGAYVSTEVAERALSGDELALGGNRQRVVCLFSDLRGFTSYSESLPPEQLVGEVNAYLEAMVAAATSDGGVIDKYIGDAIMVVFGATTPHPDDAARAIRTARAMQRAMVQHNRDRKSRGLPMLAQGIGIHGGHAVVGNVGTASRMQHTVMGSVVNIASRLEAATKDLDVPVLVSADVVDEARDREASLPTLRALPPMQIRGVSMPLAVYTFAGDGSLPSLTGLT